MERATSRDLPLQLFLCPFLGRQVPPPAPILVPPHPHSRSHIYPHFPPRVHYSWPPSDTNTSLRRRVVWAPIVLGFWIVIFRIVGLGIVIAASFTDRQSATLTLVRQVGKCHYFEHSQLNANAHTMNIAQISQQLTHINTNCIIQRRG